ncbi:unnamed protein product [Eruca vesicaria subsp. sativa]|uniref:Uncharacterized protein n=1 Tax=Eruca vesicaria subsp. sativa TaxID=29727 RepID=A0ABC8J177_ERUVS|nr:unnamed protein product [Eruca vesicaria subsp. sativa]
MEKIDDGNYTASTASFSPSFSTYSGDNLVKIAERVGGDHYKEKGDDSFEFATLQTVHEQPSSLLFPVFDQKHEDVSPETVVTPLKDLFLREKEHSSPQQTYSSSDYEEEEDELDTIPSEIYCPWTPARSPVEMSPCRKSKSTGSSSTSTWSRKRWRLRNLLKRSRSDGKETLEFLSSSPVNNKDESSSSSPCPKNKEAVKTKKKEKEKVSAHEKFYLRNKAMKEEDKRKSYLPYKQELVGLFSNIHRHGKAFPPF